MKGSAITGPVAKECVRTRMYLFRLTMLTRDNPGGLMATYCVERWHSSLGSWKLPSDQIVIHVSLKCHIQPREICDDRRFKARKHPNLAVQVLRVGDPGICIALQYQLAKVYHGYRTKIKI